MTHNRTLNVGIGFATGRRSFQKVLKTNVYNWKESGLTDRDHIRLNLIVAYDLKYSNTKPSDYTNISPEVNELLDHTYFIGKSFIDTEVQTLLAHQVITQKEAELFFGSGYAAKRNAILYSAIKNKLDCLLYFDDDEYPMAVTRNRKDTLLWSGQHVLSEHLKYIQDADLTNGQHCGYISPIPHISFNEVLSEETFGMFIEAISNDIIQWDKMRRLMEDGGVTYADTELLVQKNVREVEEVNHAKFISGANLCINLTRPERVHPFYNPPGARGEDTFLSTCLHARKVLRIPCYTFHDGFSSYQHLMDGVLPLQLKTIEPHLKANVLRFYRSCIGWIRYKPLFLYITSPQTYMQRIEQMRAHLDQSLPAICAYFGNDDFMNIRKELELYHRDVQAHYQQFLDTQQIWQRLTEFLQAQDAPPSWPSPTQP